MLLYFNVLRFITDEFLNRFSIYYYRYSPLHRRNRKIIQTVIILYIRLQWLESKIFRSIRPKWNHDDLIVCDLFRIIYIYLPASCSMTKKKKKTKILLFVGLRWARSSRHTILCYILKKIDENLTIVKNVMYKVYAAKICAVNR